MTPTWDQLASRAQRNPNSGEPWSGSSFWRTKQRELWALEEWLPPRTVRAPVAFGSSRPSEAEYG